MTTPLIRESIKESYSTALKDTASGDYHAGLILDKGYPEDDPKNSTAKTDFIQSLCKTQSNDFYKNVFNRWLILTEDNDRFLQSTFTLENRLLIGLNGAGALETGCSISHTHGMPYIPGSSIKGAIRSWVQKNENLKAHKTEWIELFGSAPDEDDDDSFSGLVTFHDAWWVPGKAPTNGGSNSNSPFTQDIVTSHHPEYYSKEGAEPASDMDSPVPNALVGVHGSFLFVLEGETEHTDVVKNMLKQTLADNGVGAKTSSGYGYFNAAPKILEELLDELRKKKAENNFVIATLLYESGKKKIAAKLPNKKITSDCTLEQYDKFLKLLGDVKSSGFKSRVKSGKVKIEVKVKEKGNKLEIIDLRPISD